MASTKRGRTINQEEKVDRLSSLPDDVISHILSLLPTECAVRTSVLSTRWKYLWTSINSLEFNCFKCASNTIMSSKLVDFAKFVERVLRNCKSAHIQKLNLNFPIIMFDQVRVKAWIDKAIKLNVSEMYLNIDRMPFSVFSCRTLTVLSFSAYLKINLKDTCSFNLPSLKVLHIKRGSLYKDCMEKLISCCPVLEELTLAGSIRRIKGDDIFRLSASTLKILRLQPRPCQTPEISVKAPNLEYLNLGADFVRYKFTGDFSSLVKANVSIGNIFRDTPYRPSLRELPHTFTLPKFLNLKRLEVVACHELFWSMLPAFIEVSPSLEVLSIKLDGDYMPPDEQYTWVEPTSVPKCVSFHLTVVEIEAFEGGNQELLLQLFKYFLGHAKVLKRLTINCQGLNKVEMMQLYGQLQTFSRVSRHCQIQFHGDLISDL